jgi:hypothetical protein
LKPARSERRCAERYALIVHLSPLGCPP